MLLPVERGLHSTALVFTKAVNGDLLPRRFLLELALLACLLLRLSESLLLLSESPAQLSARLLVKLGRCRLLLDNALLFVAEEHLDLILLVTNEYHIGEADGFFPWLDNLAFLIRSGRPDAAVLELDDRPRGNELGYVGGDRG